MTTSNFPTLAVTILVMAGTVFADSYTKYTDYPPYCSTNAQMEERSIPRLDNKFATNGSLKLMHVTAVIRHGARTPTTANQCWEGHDIYSDAWNCKLTTLMAPQTEAALIARAATPQTEKKIEKVTTDDDILGVDDKYEDDDDENDAYTDDLTQANGQGEQLMYEKVFDAHYSATGKHYSQNMRNALGGTCQVGQLLSEGYNQQMANGNILKNAYVRDDSESLNQTPDPELMLWDFDQDIESSYKDRAYEGKNLYFRADDYQRTLVSGQVLLQTVFDKLIKRHVDHSWVLTDLYGNELKDDSKQSFNPVIQVHTNDKDTDTLAPNHKICPRLDELEAEAMASAEYEKKFVESEESVLLEQMIEDLGDADQMEDPDTAIDCLMTSMCTDRSLPDALNDFDLVSKDKNSMFQKVTDNALSKKTFVFDHNKAAYAKLAMTPLWSDILSNFLLHTSIPLERLQKTWPDIRRFPPKFALFAAHDTTIMGLLSSLDLMSDLNKWPAYASMLLIELYSIDTTYLSTDLLKEVNDIYPTEIAFRMIYNGEVVTQLMPRCESELCDIYNLIDHLSEYADISQWGDDCKKTKNNTSPKLPIIKKEKKKKKPERYRLSIMVVILLCVSCTLVGVMITYIRLETYWRGEQAKHHEIVSMDLGPEEADACGAARVYGVVPPRELDINTGRLT